MDAILLGGLIFGAFLVYELYSGEVPMRFFGSIYRDQRPFIYWLFILIHLGLLGVVLYAWMDGLRIPLDEFVDGLFD
jgi:hypothetical protein